MPKKCPMPFEDGLEEGLARQHAQRSSAQLTVADKRSGLRSQVVSQRGTPRRVPVRHRKAPRCSHKTFSSSGNGDEDDWRRSPLDTIRPLSRVRFQDPAGTSKGRAQSHRQLNRIRPGIQRRRTASLVEENKRLSESVLKLSARLEDLQARLTTSKNGYKGAVALLRASTLAPGTATPARAYRAPVSFPRREEHQVVVKNGASASGGYSFPISSARPGADSVGSEPARYVSHLPSSIGQARAPGKFLNTELEPYYSSMAYQPTLSQAHSTSFSCQQAEVAWPEVPAWTPPALSSHQAVPSGTPFYGSADQNRRYVSVDPNANFRAPSKRAAGRPFSTTGATYQLHGCQPAAAIANNATGTLPLPVPLVDRAVHSAFPYHQFATTGSNAIGQDMCHRHG